MKRCLIIAASDLSKTGVPAVFMRIIRHFSKKGWNFDLIYFDNNDTYYLKELNELSVSTYFFKEKRNKLFRYFSANFYKKIAKKVIVKDKYDIVHSFKENVGYPFLKRAKKMGVKTIINHTNIAFHGNGNFINHILFSKEQKAIIKYSTDLIGCSKEACLSAYGKKAICHPILNTYDERQFVFSPNNPNTKPIQLIQVGGFSSLKNQLFSLKVINEIIKIYPDSTVVFIGNETEESYFNKMKEYIKENSIEKNVIFKGKEDDVSSSLKESHYMIFPSVIEGFGIVAIEAQAVGLRCFASTGVPQSTDAGNITYLSLQDGEAYWAQQIIDNFKNQKSTRKKSDMSKFSNDFIMKEYEKIYE